MLARRWVLAAVFVVLALACRKNDAESAPAAPPSDAPAAPASPSASAAEPLPGRVAEPLLWEVQDGDKRMWLFGTLHIGVAAEQLPAVVWEKLAAAKTFVMETDVSDPAVVAGMAEEAMLPPGRNLKSELGPELWEKTVAATGGAVPESMLARFEPWFVVVTISAQLMPSTHPMDASLQARAKEEGDALVYLESWREQLGMLEQAMDIEVLRDTVRRLDREKKMAQAMHRAYLAGDASALGAIAFSPEEMKRHPELYKKLFFDRNDRWMPTLEAELARGNVFVAVGAAHLLGERGLVAMLKARGHGARRMGTTP